jgi:hypothetical protein
MPDFVKATPMTSRSPAKAQTTRAESDRPALLRNLVAAIAGLARHVVPLGIASGSVFLAMAALELFYFEQLSDGQASLDLRLLGFTPDEGMAWLTALGRRGSEIIIVWHYLTFDLLFPALFSLTLLGAIVALGTRLPFFARMSEGAQALLAVGLVLPYTLADYAENIAVMRLLSDFLYANPDSLTFASMLVVAKFVLLLVPLAATAALYAAGRKAT